MKGFIELVLNINGFDSYQDAVLIDDVQIASPESKNITIHITCSQDISGIKGFSWVMDSASGTVPAKKVNLTGNKVTIKNKPGWFHIRACDGKGNWGNAKHFRIKD